VRVRDPERRDPEDKASARLFRHRHLEHLRLCVALHHPGGHQSGRAGDLGGNTDFRLLPGHGIDGLRRRSSITDLQVSAQGLPDE